MSRSVAKPPASRPTTARPAGRRPARKTASPRVAPLPPPARRTGRGDAAAQKTWRESFRERRAKWSADARAWGEARLHDLSAWGARRFPRAFAVAENALGLTSADLIRPREVGVDRVLAGAVLGLAAFGTVMVFSAGAVFAAKKYGDAFYFLKRQLIYLSLGLGAMAIAVRTDYNVYRRMAYPMLFASILALAAVLKLGGRAGGAIRWFRLGPLSFQPSELAKFALCAYLATLLARKAEKVRVFSIGFLPPLVVTGAMMLLLLKQPDLGTAVIFGVVALSLLFVAGTRTSYILVALLIAAPAGWKFIVSTPFRMRRMLAFLDPWAFRRDVGYQITESLMSVGSGGLTGAGLGDGRQKLFFLPEAHTDFILSIIGEELGLIGVLGVLGTFGVFVWRGLRTSYRARDVFGTYLAFGITAMFGLQALTNIGVVLGSLPAKGLTLPFISYGGSSLIVSLFMAGVLVNISARNPEPKQGWSLGRNKRAKTKNRRRDRGPKLVVEVPRWRKPKPVVDVPSAPSSELGAEPSAEGAGRPAPTAERDERESSVALPGVSSVSIETSDETAVPAAPPPAQVSPRITAAWEIPARETTDSQILSAEDVAAGLRAEGVSPAGPVAGPDPDEGAGIPVARPEEITARHNLEAKRLAESEALLAKSSTELKAAATAALAGGSTPTHPVVTSEIASAVNGELDAPTFSMTARGLGPREDAAAPAVASPELSPSPAKGRTTASRLMAIDGGRSTERGADRRDRAAERGGGPTVVVGQRAPSRHPDEER